MKRLQELLASGRLTPASTPVPSSPAPTEEAASSSGAAGKRRGVKRAHPKPKLESVKEGSVLPDSINYIVAVSSRSPDVGLENDHNLHCLCSFPTHQSAYDWILRHRLALARHYLQDPRLSEAELQAASAEYDELYLGESTSMEILQVPHFNSAAGAPPPEGEIFADHFASKRSEEEHDAAQAAEAEGDDAEEAKEAAAEDDAKAAPAANAKGKRGAAAGKAGAKRRKT